MVDADKMFGDGVQERLYSAMIAGDGAKFEQILTEIKSGDSNIAVVLNTPDKDGNTILHDIAWHGGVNRAEFFELCIKNGADPMVKNNQGYNVFNYYLQGIPRVDKRVVEALISPIPLYEMFGPIDVLHRYPTYEELDDLRVKTYNEYDYFAKARNKMKELATGGREEVAPLLERKMNEKIGQISREERVMTAIRFICNALKEKEGDPEGALREIEEGITRICNLTGKAGGMLEHEYFEGFKVLIVNVDYMLGERPLDLVLRKLEESRAAQDGKAEKWAELKGLMTGYGAKTSTQIAEILKDAQSPKKLAAPGGVDAGGSKTGNRSKATVG
ncbi:Uncharacterised protein [Candidatus Gugararchaeum adminiculabundum]|nr:Uncharacterised protein [Candidatus Gugararchaeum adminiculabundum]